MAEGHDNSRGYTRRGVLTVSAALGVAATGAAAVAATARASDAVLPDSVGLDAAATTGPAEGADSAAGGLWGVAVAPDGTGVRGNGRIGILGEGTHTGVAGDGFVGVVGTTSSVNEGHVGVGVWAQADTPGGVALRTDGPSHFNGVTDFARSGVVLVPRGARSVTKTGVTLAPDTVIMATLQTLVAGVHLHAVETDTAAGSFTIFLTTAPDKDVAVGWLALG